MSKKSLDRKMKSNKDSDTAIEQVDTFCVQIKDPKLNRMFIDERRNEAKSAVAIVFYSMLFIALAMLTILGLSAVINSLSKAS